MLTQQVATKIRSELSRLGDSRPIEELVQGATNALKVEGMVVVDAMSTARFSRISEGVRTVRIGRPNKEDAYSPHVVDNFRLRFEWSEGSATVVLEDLTPDPKPES